MHSPENIKRFDQLIEKIASLASLNFKDEIKLSSEMDRIDAIALGLNMLGEELHNKVVERSQLIEMNRDLEKFATVTAHDLKSPLSSMMMLSGCLLKMHDDDLKPEALNMLKILSFSAEKMKGLVNGILEFGQNSNVVNEEKQEVGLHDFIGGIIPLINFQNEYNISYPKEETVISINVTALQQILLNLIVNSIKYCDKDEININIGFSESEDFYHFSVKDNGLGISQEDQAKIFDLFHTLDGDDRFGNKGNGIGLSTVKNLVTNMGGSISIESELGKGSVFTFTTKKSSKIIQNKKTIAFLKDSID